MCTSQHGTGQLFTAKVDDTHDISIPPNQEQNYSYIDCERETNKKHAR